MRNGKHPFDAQSNPEPPSSTDFTPLPDEESFRFKPSPARRQPTPRDIARNRGAKQLFDHIVPGLPIDADPPETRQAPQAFSSVIEATLKRLNIQTSPWLDELAGAWTTILPPEIVKVARPGKWDNGILYIYVSSSVHLFELRRTSLKKIEEAVQRFAGDKRIKHVRLMVNDVKLPFNR